MVNRGCLHACTDNPDARKCIWETSKGRGDDEEHRVSSNETDVIQQLLVPILSFLVPSLSHKGIPLVNKSKMPKDGESAARIVNNFL